ncbi:hypothetical protein A6J66_023100 [Yersinia enterocolitica]|nr:hypothetical protein A6J66_023100 [Yersinia enterocolitica]
MNMYLIVDDDYFRRSKIKEILISKYKIPEDNIDLACCTKEARTLFRNTNYSIAFIDMSLPENKDEKPKHNSGVDLLTTLRGNRYRKPSYVVGFTALEENVKELEEEFDNRGFKFCYATNSDYSWLGEISGIIEYYSEYGDNFERNSIDIAIVTVHGIRTFGNWQETLANEIRTINVDKKVSHLCFKVAFTNTARFFVPYLRRKVVEKFKLDFEQWLDKNRTRRIVCFAHSFGTYVLIKGIESIEDKTKLKNLDLIVLAGSVLRRDNDFCSLQNSINVKIINDCAVNDIPLLFSEALVPGAGMGGRLGFKGLHHNKIMNRFFVGGHSSFFENGFMDKYWIPLLKDKEIKEDVNNAETSIVMEILNFISLLLGKVKNFIVRVN